MKMVYAARFDKKGHAEYASFGDSLSGSFLSYQ